MATSEYTLLLHRVGRWQPWFMSHVACVCCACACGPHHHSSSRHFAPLPAIFFPPFESRLSNVRKHVTLEDGAGSSSTWKPPSRPFHVKPTAADSSIIAIADRPIDADDAHQIHMHISMTMVVVGIVWY